jgi:serine/threonine protein kinase
MYDPASPNFSKHYKSSKVLGKGQYGIVRSCTLTRGAHWHSNKAKKVNGNTQLSSDTVSTKSSSKSVVHPMGLSLDLMSSTENWPSLPNGTSQHNYQAALRDLVLGMTPQWRAQMRSETADESGTYACKYLDKERTVAKATFLELYALATMRHQNILRLVEAFQDPDQFYFVTNRCHGDLNSRWVQKAKTPPLPYIQKVAVQLLDALDYIDGFRLVHRDVKPANVFLKTPREYSDICIGDFGMAVPMDGEGASEEIAGSPAFFAKEVWTEGRQAASSDVFAAGLTLLALFAGGHPISLENHLNICPEILRNDSMPPKQLWRKWEMIATGDERLICKTLRSHCPRDVEKRITLAIVACILSSPEVMEESIVKAGVEQSEVHELFKILLAPNTADRATARTGYEYASSMQRWGSLPASPSRVSVVRRFSNVVIAAVQPKKKAPVNFSASANYESGAICRRRLSLVGVCDTKDVAADASQPFSPLPRLMGNGAPADPWNEEKSSSKGSM